jgi:hypothetical protein
MSMSKKDFIALADELRPLMKDEAPYSRVGPFVIDALCRFMRTQNANFKEDRWRAYLAGKCGPNGGEL